MKTKIERVMNKNQILSRYNHPFRHCKIYNWDISYAIDFDKSSYQRAEIPEDLLSQRRKIVAKLNLTEKQRKFLVMAWDVDLLVICDKDISLVEEKSFDVDGVEFNRRSTVYCDMGTTTQFFHLLGAKAFGIEAGILLNLNKFTYPSRKRKWKCGNIIQLKI